MVLEVVHHLQAELVLHRRPMLLFLALLERFLAHGALLAHARVCVTQPRELYPVAHWVPLEVEHGVDGLDLDPPAPLLERVPDQARVVPVPDDELVAVLHVGVLEGNLADGALEDVVGVLAPQVPLVGVGRLDSLLVLLKL